MSSIIFINSHWTVTVYVHQNNKHTGFLKK